MKHFAFIVMTILASVAATSQKITPELISKLPASKQEAVHIYLQRADNARLGGFAFMGGGLALMAIGANFESNTIGFNNRGEATVTTTPTGEIFKLAGAVATLFGIRCFIQIHKNRQKARALVFAGDGITATPNLLVPYTPSAGVKLIIPLGK